MSEEMLIQHCSPTLAGMKTGNLFTCPYEKKEDMQQALRFWNQALSGKGVRVLPLRYHAGRALIYLYRPARLSRDLQNEAASRLLRERGYRAEAPDRCVVLLGKRIRESGEFPHEIGLFLGYPPEDVSGFIENCAERCKCAGCWKVYGDVEAAKQTFARYKKCTQVYWNQYTRGKSVERLTVVG